jgi:carbon storage regulator
LLGDDIRIVILAVEADRIKIGIEAPGSTKILRGELVAAVRDLNREATQSAAAYVQGLENSRPSVAEAEKPSLTAEGATPIE